MSNFLDRIKPEDRAKIIERYEKRVAQNQKAEENKITNEIYLLAEFGYYYGWQAVLSVRNNEISIHEMYALLEGARKVWYKKLLEQGQMTTTACIVPHTKKGDRNKAFNEGMKSFIEKGKI